jgi:hypothetical protein
VLALLAFLAFLAFLARHRRQLRHHHRRRRPHHVLYQGVTVPPSFHATTTTTATTAAAAAAAAGRQLHFQLLHPGEKQTRKLRSRARGKVKNTNVVRKNTNVVREKYKFCQEKYKCCQEKYKCCQEKNNTVVREKDCAEIRISVAVPLTKLKQFELSGFVFPFHLCFDVSDQYTDVGGDGLGERRLRNPRI